MIQTVRPVGDGRPTAVFVFNELRLGAGRLTQLWLDRLRAFSRAGWATHAALINRDDQLEETVDALMRAGEFPRETLVHHFAARDRRIRPVEWATPPAGESIDPVVSNWLDWLTGRLPGAVVFADSPAAYPYLAAMTNPLTSRIAGVHLNHLARGDAHHPGGSMTPRFAERFEPVARRFAAIVVATEAQARDLREQFGQDFPVEVIRPSVPPEAPLDPPADAEGVRLRIVSHGPLEPASRHAHVIRALASIGEQTPAVLDIYGDGSNGAELLRLAEEVGLSGRVRIHRPDHPQRPFTDAAAVVWAGKRDACPLPIIRALQAGIPVVAYDVPYGPAELVADGRTGRLAASGDVTQLAAALREVLEDPRFAMEARALAPGIRDATSAQAVGRQWRQLATRVDEQVWDRDAPVVCVDWVRTTHKQFRMPGMLVNSALSYTEWFIELPILERPAGFLSDPRVPGSWNRRRRGPDPNPDPDQRVREIIVHMRSNALAYVATNTGQAHTLNLQDSSGGTARLLSADFEPVLMASRVGNAVLSRQPDATLQIAPLPELLFAEQVDGRLHSRIEGASRATDVTHAISWGVDIDWSDLSAADGGASFHGTLRAKRIAPAPGSAPAICVRDAGGYSRVVGQMHYEDEPEIEDLSWRVRVGGIIQADPLVATTSLARGALALHVGFRGLLAPIGGLWTHGNRAPIFLTCPRGQVTLLPSPGGRVLAAPGRGRRARYFGAVRTALGRA